MALNIINSKVKYKRLKRWYLPIFQQCQTPAGDLDIHTLVHITLKRISNWPLYKIWYYAKYLDIRTNLGMMLARDCPSCHAARSTLVMLVANNVQKFRW